MIQRGFRGLLFCILLFSAVLPAFAHESTYTLCYEDQPVPPFIVPFNGSIHELGNGIVMDYINLAANAVDMTVEYQSYPWKRCQLSLKNGSVDGAFVFVHDADRDNWAVFPKTDGKPDDRFVYLSQYVFFVGKETTLTWDGTALTPADALVQSVPGYVAESRLITMGFNPVVSLQPKEALPLVANGRLDGFVMDSVVGQTLVDQLGLTSKITTLPLPFMVQPWYVVFSKQHYREEAETIEAFWTALKLIREQQGEAITAQYMR